MDNLEKAEKIREKTGVTYDEAKRALEACNYDMLDAVVYLETLGVIRGPQMGTYYTQPEMNSSEEFSRAQAEYKQNCKGGRTFGESLDSFFGWCGKILKRSMEIKFQVIRNNEELFKIPLLLLILFSIFSFGITIVVLLIGLFCDYRYRFEDIDEVKFNVNDMCDRAGEKVGEIKNDFRNKNNSNVNSNNVNYNDINNSDFNNDMNNNDIGSNDKDNINE